MIAPGTRAVPNPIGIAADLISSGEAVRAGFLRVQREAVLAGLAARRHSVRFEVVAVVAGDDAVAIWRYYAVLNAIPVGVSGRAIAPVQIREHLDCRQIRSVGREEDGERH